MAPEDLIHRPRNIQNTKALKNRRNDIIFQLIIVIMFRVHYMYLYKYFGIMKIPVYIFNYEQHVCRDDCGTRLSEMSRKVRIGLTRHYFDVTACNRQVLMTPKGRRRWMASPNT